MDMEKILFEEMIQALEKRNELELQLVIAEEEFRKLKSAYLAYKQK